MKKIAIALLGICLSGAALADTVRIINTDKSDMTIHTQLCTFDQKSGQTTCADQAPVFISGLDRYKDLPTPGTDDTYLHVAAVSAANQGVVIAKGRYLSEKTCTGSKSGDVIVLDTYGTDTVLCNDHLVGR